MLCEECGTREATFAVSVVSGEETKMKHLCAECMSKWDMGISGTQIRDLLSSIFSAITSGEKKEKKEETTQLSEQRRSVTCSACGTTLADFMKNGHLGCPDCYSAFREEIQPMLQQMHGRLQHVGRRPLHSEDAQRSRTLQEDLTRKMEQAVSLEDFETAAKIRDQLKALSSKEGQL